MLKAQRQSDHLPSMRKCKLYGMNLHMEILFRAQEELDALNVKRKLVIRSRGEQ